MWKGLLKEKDSNVGTHRGGGVIDSKVKPGLVKGGFIGRIIYLLVRHVRTFKYL